MDYLSFKFLKSGTDLNRASDEKLRKPTPQSPSTGPTPSPSSIKTTGSSSLSTPSRPISHLRNADPLPASFAALEGHLNHHASQLQQLADRVEAINDWIELDSIVLARLIRDEEKRVDDLIDTERRVAAGAADQVKRAGTVRFELDQRPNGPNNRHLGPPPFLPPSMSMSMADKGKRSASMGDVPRTTSVPDEPSKEKTVSDRKKEGVNAHAGIQEVRERIRGMRRWRKEVERSVVWQREEFWRVEKGMGKKKGRQSVVAPAAQGKENKEGDAEGKGGDGGGGGGDGEGKKEGDQHGGALSVVKTGALSVVKTGAKWEEGKKGKWKGKDVSGERLPTQKEWEGLFG